MLRDEANSIRPAYPGELCLLFHTFHGRLQQSMIFGSKSHAIFESEGSHFLLFSIRVYVNVFELAIHYFGYFFQEGFRRILRA